MTILRGVSFLCGVSFLFPMIAAAAPAAPFANTLLPTFVTEKSARLNGTVNSNELPDTYQWFEWGLSNHPEVYETPRNTIWSGSVLANTSADIYGLAPNTSYFFRQVAENGNGKTIGGTVYFTTKALPSLTEPLVVVETHDATSLGETSAVLNGYISPHGNISGTWWFEWGETTALGQKTQALTSGWNSGGVQSTISNLKPGTTYYFRIVGENSERVYGGIKSFTTRGSVPVSVGVGVTSPEVGRDAAQIQELQNQIITLLFQIILQLQQQIETLRSSSAHAH